MSTWEVYPVCDIRLGEFFRDNPEMEGVSIDVDTTAVQKVLSALNSTVVGGTIIYKLEHDDTVATSHPNKWGKQLDSQHATFGEYPVGMTTPASTERITQVQIGVAGNAWVRLREVATGHLEADEVITDICEDIKLQGAKEAFLSEQGDYTTAVNALRYKPRAPEHIQKIAVHELCHTLSLQQKADKNEARPKLLQKRALGLYAVAGLLGAAPAAGATAGYAYGELTGAPDYAKVLLAIGGGIVSTLSGMIFGGDRIMRAEEKEEQAALDTERFASSLPTTISFTKIASLAEPIPSNKQT